MFRNSKNLFQNNLFRKLIYSFGISHFRIGFLNYITFYYETIISEIGDTEVFSSLHYYFKSNLDNFKNFGVRKERFRGAGRCSPA